MSSWDRVVVGFDGSDESEQALRWACQEAKTHGLDVVVVSTQSIPLVAIDPPFGSFPWGAGTDLPAGNREEVERAVLDTLAEYPEVTDYRGEIWYVFRPGTDSCLSRHKTVRPDDSLRRAGRITGRGL